MMEALKIAVERVRKAIEIYKPSKVFALYSGGHDSRSICEVACRIKEFSGCVHCNTGIGVEETREHVRQTCKEKGWSLLEMHAKDNTKADGTPDPQNYDDLVNAYGFPGPGHHQKMYDRLKDRSLALLMRKVKLEWKDKIMFIAGCRSSESVRRMGHVEPLQKAGARIWVSPIHDWEKHDIKSLFEQEGIQRNPVVECLGMSGECLCGAFAKPGELDRVATEFPYIGERLDRLHEEVKHKFPWKWDEAPPEPTKLEKEMKRGQIVMPFMPMCWNCNKRESVLPVSGL